MEDHPSWAGHDSSYAAPEAQSWWDGILVLEYVKLVLFLVNLFLAIAVIYLRSSPPVPS